MMSMWKKLLFIEFIKHINLATNGYNTVSSLFYAHTVTDYEHVRNNCQHTREYHSFAL
jgi:hypothetical protein